MGGRGSEGLQGWGRTFLLESWSGVGYCQGRGLFMGPIALEQMPTQVTLWRGRSSRGRQWRPEPEVLEARPVQVLGAAAPPARRPRLARPSPSHV